MKKKLNICWVKPLIFLDLFAYPTKSSNITNILTVFKNSSREFPSSPMARTLYFLLLRA